MWPEAEKTEELLAGVREGDAEAINRLMDRHRDSIRRMVQLRLDQKIQRRIDASDVASSSSGVPEPAAGAIIAIICALLPRRRSQM